jgi:organic radical activating enzyme
VKESWNAQLHPLTHVDEIVERATACPAGAVVLTGGEPGMYKLSYLCDCLRKNNIDIFLETSGAYKLDGEFDWICFSPKKKSPPNASIYNKADELKVIIADEEDFKWAESQAEKVRPQCLLYLQAEWSVSDQIMPAIIDYILAHPKWQISLQSHKYMHIP